MAPTRFLNGELALTRFDPALVTALAEGLDRTDALGDAIVEACRGLPGGGRNAVDAWLTGVDGSTGAELPPELRELLEPIASVPDWVDWERIDRGCVAYWRGGMWTMLALNCASLAAGYRSSAGVKPLVLTGRLLRMAPRRQQETARWALAATVPGGLRRGAPGWVETIRVRLVHAWVRRRILATGSWRADEWGAPINLTDTAYGIAGEFSTVPVAAMRDVGLHYGRAEREDIQHVWRYVGHLLGLPEELSAAGEARAREIIGIKDLTDTPADDDSRALLRALIEHGTPPELLVPAPFARLAGVAIPPLLYGLTRRWAGAEVADEMGIPDTPLKHLVPALRPLVKGGELARRAGLRDDARIAGRIVRRATRMLDVGRAPSGILPAEEAGAAVR